MTRFVTATGYVDVAGVGEADEQLAEVVADRLRHCQQMSMATNVSGASTGTGRYAGRRRRAPDRLGACDRVWLALEGERGSLVDVLASLTEVQWAKPSLCTGWTVRDVAAGLGRPGRSARVGSALAMVGTAVFFMVALASIPINDQLMDEPPS